MARSLEVACYKCQMKLKADVPFAIQRFKFACPRCQTENEAFVPAPVQQPALQPSSQVGNAGPRPAAAPAPSNLTKLAEMLQQVAAAQHNTAGGSAAVPAASQESFMAGARMLQQSLPGGMGPLSADALHSVFQGQDPFSRLVREAVLKQAAAQRSGAQTTHITSPPEGGGDALFEEEEGDVEEVSVQPFMEYRPTKWQEGALHPHPVVESSTLSAVEPPDLSYEPLIGDIIRDGLLSCVQAEAIVYMCQRHQQVMGLDEGHQGLRAGFFLGDGAGVGKGRTIAGLILENWRAGRRKAVWVSTGSDLRVDARRDLDDIGGHDIPLHVLGKLPYSRLSSKCVGVHKGVLFATYATLTAASDRGYTRTKQIIEWVGREYDGPLCFDECHKAKNLVAGTKGQAPTKTGLAVLQLQRDLPNARVLYCSATGVSELRNMGYMERLGLWGAGSRAFKDFASFMASMGSRGVGALEIIAMDMKTRGMYLCRTLSYTGAEFQTVTCDIDPVMRQRYLEATQLWCQLKREYTFAETQQGDAAGPSKGSAMRFWSTHQRFFRLMCISAKVPKLVQEVQQALENGCCAVIGLQSTGQSATELAVSRKGTEEFDDFVSGPKELLIRFVEDTYPLPDLSDEEDEAHELRELAARLQRENQDGRRQRVSKHKSLKEPSSDSSAFEDEDGDDSDDEGGDDSDGGDGGDGGDDSKAKKEEGHSSGSEWNEGNGKLPSDDSDGSGGASGSASESGYESGAEDGDSSRGDKAVKNKAGSTAPSTSGLDSEAPTEAGSKKSGNAEPAKPKVDKAKKANGSLKRKRVKDKAAERDKKRALYQELKKRRDQVLAAVCALDLPPNPLDDIIEQLGGTSRVAEMTGRRSRLVRTDSKLVLQKRNADLEGVTLEQINIHEKDLFTQGDKLVAIISEAASAGISLHADRRFKNQRRRVHFTLELPWSADKAIQQLGRSHRANQVSAPLYKLMVTNMGGEARFATTVGKRLQSLGALTQGDRRAGVALETFNYDDAWGQKALRKFYGSVLEEEAMLVDPRNPKSADPPPRYSHPEVKALLGKMRAQLLAVGLLAPADGMVLGDLDGFMDAENGAPVNAVRLTDKERADMMRFLNRLLGIAPDMQQLVFDFFEGILRKVIDTAKKEGRYDDGIADLQGSTTHIMGTPQTLFTDEASGAKSLLYVVEVDRGVMWESAQKLCDGMSWEASIASVMEGCKEEGSAGGQDAEADAGQPEKTASKETPTEVDADPEGGIKEEGAASADGAVKEDQGGEGVAGPGSNAGGDGEEKAPASTAKRKRGHGGEAVAEQTAPLPKRVTRSGSGAASDKLPDTSTRTAKSRRKGKAETTEKEDTAQENAPVPNENAASPKQDGKGRTVRRTKASIASKRMSAGQKKEDTVEAASPKPAEDMPTAPSMWGKGQFYRSRLEAVGGHYAVLLALPLVGTSPAIFRVIRPVTGIAKKPMTQGMLQNRYEAISAEDAQALWEEAYTSSGPASKSKSFGNRVRTYHLMAGAILPVWDVVEGVLLKYSRHKERVMRIVRLQITDGSQRRVVGVLMPEDAVQQVTEKLRLLQQPESTDQGKKKQGAA